MCFQQGKQPMPLIRFIVKMMMGGYTVSPTDSEDNDGSEDN